MNINLNSFVDWVKEKPRTRSIKIEIRAEDPYFLVRKITYAGVEVQVFVYDRGLDVGQFVQTVDEIELEKRVEERERALWAQLKEKYGGGDAA